MKLTGFGDPNPLIRELAPEKGFWQFRPLALECRVLQFSRPLSDSQYIRAAKLLADRTDVTLRAYGDYSGSFSNLEFLRFFSAVRRVQIDLYRLQTIDGLRHLSKDLDGLALGSTAKAFSLTPLARFETLADLHLDGHARDIAAVGELVGLTRLSLRSITLPDLAPFLPLRGFRKFELRLGGTRDIGLLPSFPTLQYVELWMVKGLVDLSSVGNIPALEYLFLQSLKHVKALPDFTKLKCLRRVHLEQMKGVTDLAPLSTAPALEELVLIDMGHLAPDALSPLLGHPTLKALQIGLGSARKNEAVRLMFPTLGPVDSFTFDT